MDKYDAFSDDELILLLQSGDRLAFKQIYDRYWAVLYLHAKHMLKDEENARDVVQELFANLWKNASTMQITHQLKGYLYQAVRNSVLNVIRREKKAAMYERQLAESYIEASSSTQFEINYNELKQLIERHIATLPPKMKQVFVMSRQQHLTHAQIAEHLNISHLTVKKQINKALHILRHGLDISLVLALIY